MGNSTGSGVQQDEGLYSDEKRKPAIVSFRHAWEGLAFCFDTQRHMRIHFTIIVLVMLAAWSVGITGTEFMQLLTAMAVVLIAEMLNTVVEVVVELLVDGYDQRAKIAKDVAAGAVLLAAVYAVSIAAIVFAGSPRVHAVFSNAVETPPGAQYSPAQLVIVGATLMAIFVIWLKRATGEGTFWKGGVISGHSALGFMCAIAAILLTKDVAVMLLVLALALMLMQSRVQAGIHSWREALLGSLAGSLLALLLFAWVLN
ncbi:MAG: diacylglycerol kinase [Armatimonadota bacterium]